MFQVFEVRPLRGDLIARLLIVSSLCHRLVQRVDFDLELFERLGQRRELPLLVERQVS